MGLQENAYPLRIDKGAMAKLKIVAKDHGRSVNKEIETIVRAHVATYEAQHGEIEVKA